MTIAMHKATKGPNIIWSKAEDAILTGAIRSGFSEVAMIEALPGRTARAIQSRAKKLGMKLSFGAHARMPAPPEKIEAEVIRLCTYLKDDAYIASYVGTSKENVARLRAIGPARLKQTTGVRGRPRVHDKRAEGVDGELMARAATRIASANLHSAMIRHYEARAKRDGCSVPEAMIACLYGRAPAARFQRNGAGHV